MNKKENTNTKQTKGWVYLFILLLFVAGSSYVLLSFGDKASYISPDSPDALGQNSLSAFNLFLESVRHNFAEPISLLLLQIIVIMIVVRIFSLIFTKIGQPTVIGEILAGIVLGPSLLGHLFPDAFNFIFASNSLDNLYLLSQIGLVLFMFIIGLELDMTAIKEKFEKTFIISISSVVVPFFCGILISYFYYEELSTGEFGFLPFALFIGISMSITAFPVLARIIQEKELTHTRLGVTAIACAANIDVIAWCLLAAVIAVVKTGSLASSLYTMSCAIIYALGMIFVVRPFLSRIGKAYSNMEVMNKSIFAFFILLLIGSAFITQYIGIHALFGAFLFGLMMPPLPRFRKMFIRRVEDLSVTLFLPLFFAYMGLNTQIDAINTPHLWGVCGTIIIIAILAKVVGSAIPAYLTGESLKDSFSLGVLMNTHGLMELIVLNIGYEMGILPPAVFTVFVILTLLCSSLTTPILALIDKVSSEREAEEEYQISKAQGIFRVLIAIGNPQNGKAMLMISKSVLEGVKKSLDITVLHITQGSYTNPIYGEDYEKEITEALEDTVKTLATPVHYKYKVADNVQASIVKKTNFHRYDFLMVGANTSLYEKLKEGPFKRAQLINRLLFRFRKRAFFYPGTLIQDKTRYFIEHSNCSVGVFVNHDFKDVKSTVLFLHQESDLFLLRYARYLLKNIPSIKILVLDRNNILQKESLRKPFDSLVTLHGDKIKISKNSITLSKQSFMLISYTTWEMLTEVGSPILNDIPSTLIISKVSSRAKQQELEPEYNEFHELEELIQELPTD